MAVKSRALLAAFALGLLLATVWNIGKFDKQLAVLKSVKVSPQGCYRIEVYEPRWLLPAPLHFNADPQDPEKLGAWLSLWEMPGFYRLYDHRNGQLLTETPVYDLALHSDVPGAWYEATNGQLAAGFIDLGPQLPDCVERRTSQLQPSTETHR